MNACPDTNLYRSKLLISRFDLSCQLAFCGVLWFYQQMSEMTAEEFFRVYEKANRESDVELVSKLYADTFLFAGPQGVQAVKKEDFLKVLPRRKEFMKTAGLVSSQVESVEATKLDSKYILAKTVWKMRVRANDGGEVFTRTAATYVLSAAGESYEIVFQVDHQDLGKTLEAVRGAVTKVIPDAQDQ